MTEGNGEQGRALTPVVGVILLVGVAVVLAAVVGTFLYSSTDTTKPTPTTKLTFDRVADRVHVTHEGGQSLNMCNLYLIAELHHEYSERTIRPDISYNPPCPTFTSGDTITFSVAREPVTSANLVYRNGRNDALVGSVDFQDPKDGNWRAQSQYFGGEQHDGFSLWPSINSEPVVNDTKGFDGETTFGYPNQYFAATESGAVRYSQYLGTKMWEQASHVDFSGTPPVGENNRVFFYSESSNQLRGYNYWSGDQLWVDREATTTVTIGINGDVYYGKGNELVRADAQTGNVVWTKNLGSPIDMTAPTSTETGDIYITTETHLYELDLETGNIDWSQSLVGQPDKTVTYDYYQKKVIYVTDGKIVQHDAETGDVTWQSEDINAQGMTALHPSENYFVSTSDGRLAAVDDDYGIVWEQYADGEFTYPSVARDRVYAYDSGGRLVSYSANTGEMVWEKTGLSPSSTPDTISLNIRGDYIGVGDLLLEDPTPHEQNFGETF